MNTAFSLKDKVCVITGAGKGIGRELAQYFQKEGARLALLTRTEDDFASMRKDEAFSSDSVLFAGDASKPDDVARFMDRTRQAFGRVDILINNAGVRFRRPFDQTSYDEWNHVLSSNLGSVFLLCQHVIPMMKQQKSGCIINMASIAGAHGLADLSAYTASKGAMIALTKSLALELAADNIRVNAVAPGFCETSYAEDFKKKEELYAFTLERTPLKRWGRSVDIAHACHYLASEASSYVTGEVLMVDGGWSAW
jgi:NAD(P)-dependent dehydrogenase (short-subunit alcohol dehydrogenase family)